MQIYEVRSFDYLGQPDGPHLQDDLYPGSPSWGKFVECNRLVLEAFKDISLPAPENHSLVAAVITSSVIKDGPYFFGGDSSSQVEAKAGEMVLANNHIQLWVRDANGRGCLYICSLFHEKLIPVAASGKPGELAGFIRKRAVGNLERKLAERQEETSGRIAQLKELLDVERLVDNQLRLFLKDP